MSSRDLNALNADTKRLAEAFTASCRKAGIDVLIYNTLRTTEEQDILYAQGRTQPGNIVTNARGGDSWHNYGAAFDFVPMLVGKPQWKNDSLYTKCGIIAESVGLEWGGRWRGKLHDKPHCQFRNGKSLEDMKKGAGK
jgi:peptidoglycan L-alanyl-D-glutamate endopeptidase CwlK